MAKKFLFCLMAIVMILGVSLVGCGGGGGGGPEAITVKVLIRTEDERLDMGDYAALQLEDLGFTVDRFYGTSGPVSGLWMFTEPSEGLWHVATGGWVNTAVPRDEATNFGAYYTPLASYMGPLWVAYTPTPQFLDVATKLWVQNFTTMPQRQSLFEQALNWSLEDSVRMFLVERNAYSPLRTNVHLSYDGAGGIYASFLWGHTIHFRNTTNNQTLLPTGTTTAKITTAGNILRWPWNGVSGSNWVYDQFPIRATADSALEFDARDGLVWNHTASKAEVYTNNLPVSKNASHTWCTWTNVGSPIAVPDSAWADWNATTKQFITTGQKFGAGVATSLVKTVVYYPTGTFGRPIHDGSTMDEGDFLLRAVLLFDRGKPDSAIYDAAYAAELDPFLSYLKGVDFDFSRTGEGYDLVVTSYTDQWVLDAELIASLYTWWPDSTVSNARLGPMVWHNIALGVLAEEDGQLAFSLDKSGPGVDWMSLITGPSITKLQNQLTQVLNVSSPDYAYIPYSNILGPYITQGEALTRYNNLQAWKTAKGHFWVGTGPYYLETAIPPDQVVLKRFGSYPDNGNMWFFMMNPVPPANNPAHLGGWIDTITLAEQQPAQAISQLALGQLDVYAFALVDADLKTIIDGNPNLWVYYAKGSFNELTFNPSGPIFNGTGKVNPFALPAIREAMNKAIDRSYIVSNIMGGNGIVKYTCISSPGTGFTEPTRYPSQLAAIASKYAYNFAAANLTIYNAMLTIPGVTYVGGKYYYLAP